MWSKMKQIFQKKKSEKPVQLEEEQVAELTRKTKFSPQEIRKTYREFIGENPDGILTEERLKKIYRNLFSDGDASMFASFVFRTYDSNCDGVVDFQEFLTALSVTRRGTLRQKLTWIFNIYDEDGNGFISKKEMIQVLTSIEQMGVQNPGAWNVSPKKQADIIFNEMDVNGDGYLSTKEFIEGVRRNPNLEVLLSNTGHVNTNIHKF